MIRSWLCGLLLVLLSPSGYAADVSRGRLEVRESDGSPSTFPYQLNVSNSTLTDNGDGTSTLDTAGTTTTGWTKSGSNVSLTTLTDSVGIGTTSPAAALEVQGDVRLAGVAGPDLRLCPTGGDCFHLGADYSAATGSVGFFSNATDGAIYLEAENSHVVNLGDPFLTPFIRLRTTTTGDAAFRAPLSSIGVRELDIANSPTDAQTLTYQASSGRLLWASSSGGYATIQDEGTGLTARATLNFVGGAITAADNGGNARTDVTLSASPDSASVVGTGRTITVAGTANQITSSAGAQDLSANRTWTLSLPQDLATTSDATFANLILSGTGPDIRWTPTGGSTFHAGAEYAAATGSIWTLTNVTAGRSYLQIEQSHAITIGDAGVPFIQLVTGGNNDLRLPPGSVDATELATMTSGQLAGRITDERGTGVFVMSSEVTLSGGVAGTQGNQTTASATLATIPSETFVIVTGANPIGVWFLAQCKCDDATCLATFNITVDGTTILGSSGTNFRQAVVSDWQNCNLSAYTTTPVAAGAHTVAVQFARQTAGTLTISCGSGTPCPAFAMEMTD